MKIVTLLTDFGTADGYVAAMKGVILATCPDARIVDASHDIPAHDVRAGAWALRHYWKLFPRGAIHVAVVDPGVGSARQALLMRADGRWLIGPDNGLFSWVLREARARKAWVLKPGVRRPGAIGATFHGRDIFAFAAGLLAGGTSYQNLVGRAIKPFRFPWPRPTQTSRGIFGTVIHIDRFGNAITNIPIKLLDKYGPNTLIQCGDLSVCAIATCYAEVGAGKTLALEESTGLLELAMNGGNASNACSIRIGSDVSVKRG